MISSSELRIGNFDVNEEGQIKNILTGNVIATVLNDKGYPCVRICVDGKHRCFRVHRLVAIKYIPNPENKPEVNHKDGNRANHHVSNLEWVTCSENRQHSILRGIRPKYKRNVKGNRNPNSRLTDLHVKAIRELSSLGYSQNQLAAIFDVAQCTISKIQLGQLWAQS